MELNLVKVSQGMQDWRVDVIEIDGDRQRPNPPSPLGHVYCKRGTERSAFKRLKKVMVESHLKEIKRLEKSLAALQQLEYV